MIHSPLQAAPPTLERSKAPVKPQVFSITKYAAFLAEVLTDQYCSRHFCGLSNYTVDASIFQMIVTVHGP